MHIVAQKIQRQMTAKMVLQGWAPSHSEPETHLHSWQGPDIDIEDALLEAVQQRVEEACVI